MLKILAASAVLTGRMETSWLSTTLGPLPLSPDPEVEEEALAAPEKLGAHPDSEEDE